MGEEGRCGAVRWGPHRPNGLLAIREEQRTNDKCARCYLPAQVAQITGTTGLPAFTFKPVCHAALRFAVLCCRHAAQLEDAGASTVVIRSVEAGLALGAQVSGGGTGGAAG